jgi:hypothetical protein
MKGGDISNETSPRIIVTISSVVEAEWVDERVLLVKKQVLKVKKLNNLALSQLWMVADRYGLSVELAGFADEGWTQEHLDSIMDKLDRRGGNPFNYAELYDSVDEFISELPYRSNLKGVVSDGGAARFGSWGIDLENL